MTTLRPYQGHDVAAILAYTQRGESTLYALPTGGGKTLVGSTAIATIMRESPRRVLWLAHRRELICQASRQFRALRIDHGIIAPEHRFTGTDRVAIASVDTLPHRADALRAWLADVRLVVCDEAHHVVAPKWQSALALCPSAQRLGLTATPYRLDGQGLGDTFTAAVRGPSIRTLIDQGYLVEPRVYMPSVIDPSGLPKRFGEFRVKAVESLVDTDELTKAALGQYFKRLCGVRTVIYCASVAHAHHVGAAFANVGGWRTAIVHGGTPSGDRDTIFQDLAGNNLDVVCNVEVVTEGVDIPRLGGIILSRLTASTSLFQQMAGRALRPGFRKTHATILDLVGCTAIHGLPDEDRPWTLHSGLVDGHAQKAVAATQTCAACARVYRRADPACPDCGWKPARAPDRTSSIIRIEDRRLGVGDLTVGDARSMAYPEIVARYGTNRLALQLIGGARGYHPGWADRVLSSAGVGRSGTRGHRRGRAMR